MYKEDNMENLITVSQYAKENGIPKDTMDTRIYNARKKKGFHIYPVIEGNGSVAAKWKPNDLDKICDIFPRRSRNLTKRVKKVNRPNSSVSESKKSMALAGIKTIANAPLTKEEKDFAIESLFEKI